MSLKYALPLLTLLALPLGDISKIKGHLSSLKMTLKCTIKGNKGVRVWWKLVHLLKDFFWSLALPLSALSHQSPLKTQLRVDNALEFSDRENKGEALGSFFFNSRLISSYPQP